MKTKTAGHMIPNQFYTQIQGGPPSDALLCVLLELRVGGILEGMQLERVDYSPAVPYVGGMCIAVRRSDGCQFTIDTTDALIDWGAPIDWPDDRDDMNYTLATDIDAICASLQETLARMVTSIPIAGARSVTESDLTH